VHLRLAIGIDDLVTKGANAEIGALRKKHDAIGASVTRSGNETSVDWPETRDYAGDGAFAYAVGARDLHLLAAT
jgi:hypothetical protein